MNYLTGFLYYIKGILFFFSHPKLWLYAIIPGLIAFLGHFRIFNLGNWLYQQYTEQLRVKISLGIFNFLLDGIVGFIISIGGIFLFIIVNFLSTPAQKWLSEKTEEALTGKVVHISAQGNLFLRFLSGIWNLLYSVFDFIIVFLLLALANIIPFLGQIFSAYQASYYTAKNYLNFTLERRSLNYTQKKHLLKQHKGYVLGFGIACVLLLLAPFSLNETIIMFLSPFIVPFHVVGATILCLEKIDFQNTKKN